MLSSFRAPLEDIGAALRTAGMDDILQLDAFAGLEWESVQEAIAEFGRFAAHELAPLNHIGDREGSVLTPSGRVRTPPRFNATYRTYVDSGWAAAPVDEAIGG